MPEAKSLERPSDHAIGDESLVGSEVTSEQIDRVRMWFEATLGVITSKTNAQDAVAIVASDALFHPVADYLCALRWDGVPRIDGWLERFCGVVPTSETHARLVRDVAAKWLISCVARAMTPGCKVDTMLVLEGKTYLGTSARARPSGSLRALATFPTRRSTSAARTHVRTSRGSGSTKSPS
jgi:predicted P-loop ATPase